MSVFENGDNGGVACRENNSIFKTHVVSLEDLLPWLSKLGEVKGDVFELKRGLTGHKLRTPTSVSIPQMLTVGREGLIKYIIESLVKERPKLIPFVFRNRSLVKVMKYLKRKSGSLKTPYLYAHLIEYYSKWAGREPDEIIHDVAPLQNGMLNAEKIQIHKKAFDDFVDHLQDKGLSNNRIANYANAVKTFYRKNGVDGVSLSERLSRKVAKRDRAPTRKELQKLLDLADLRERVIISMLALGGFREGTLVKLKYRHVKHDLDKGTVPLHIHIEREITKGKYGDYDTFLGPEAVRYLKLYLDSRRKGTKDVPPEEITDESPLIRDANSKVPKPIGEKQLYQLVHKLYKDAKLLDNGGSYQLRVHSMRKFFKTNLLALGVQPDYVDYFMGHAVDTYHDIPSIGIDKLRQAYATANFSTSPESPASKLEIAKSLLRSLGGNPEKALLEKAFAEPHRVSVVGESEEERQMAVLSSAIRDAIKEEILAELPPFQSSEYEIPEQVGGVARI